MKLNEKTKRNAQTLRRNMTKEERHLWYDFLKSYPVQFRRQYAIGTYIVDFYCYNAHLVVELDGSQHCTPEAVEYDKKRSAYLNRQGLFVLRISNLDVIREFAGVCELIDRTVKARVKGYPSSVSPLASHLPPGEGFVQKT